MSQRFTRRKLGAGHGIWDNKRERWCDGPLTDRRLMDNLLRHYRRIAHLEGKPGGPRDLCPGVKEATRGAPPQP